MPANIILTTMAGAQGIHNDLPVALTATTAAEVQVPLPGLEMTFVPDAPVWSTADPMGYTITITNDTTYDYETPTITTDAFPASVCTIDPATVKLNGGTTGFTATVDAGVLTVILEGNVAQSSSVAITFQAEKV